MGVAMQDVVQRKAPAPSQNHVLKFFDQEVYDNNIAPLADHWPRMGPLSRFYPGTKVSMFEQNCAGQKEIQNVSDLATLTHPNALIDAGSAVSFWAIENGHACPYHQVYQ